MDLDSMNHVIDRSKKMVNLNVAWWVLHNWLDNYAFRTVISWWMFVVSGLGMIAVALATLSVQTIRAAMAKPAKSLRTE